MALTWSISRDQTLHTCERRYYFQYLAQAKANSRSDQLRRIAYLKRLKTLPMWQGEVFHGAIAAYLNSLRIAGSSEPASLIHAIEGRMRHDWANSAAHAGRLPARASTKDDGIILFEHEYREDVDDADCASAITAVVSCVEQFLRWAQTKDLVRLVREAAKIWIEPSTFGRHAPGFVVDNVQILVKVDLAVQHPDAAFHIFDWKTGRRPSPLQWQLSHGELQMAVYQLWPHLALGIPLEAVQARLVFLGSDPVEEQAFTMDGDSRDYALAVIRGSIERARRFAHYEVNGQLSLDDTALALDDFDFAPSPFVCRKCSFKALCQESLAS
jgi:hypothetical protein